MHDINGGKVDPTNQQQTSSTFEHVALRLDNFGTDGICLQGLGVWDSQGLQQDSANRIPHAAMKSQIPKITSAGVL